MAKEGKRRRCFPIHIFPKTNQGRRSQPPSLSSSSSSFFVRVFLVKKHYASSGERREPEARLLLLLLLLPLSRARRSATCIFQAVLGKGSIAGPPPVVACFYATAPCERLSLRVTLQFRIFPTVSRNICSQFPPYLGTVVGGRKGVEIVPVGGIDSRSTEKEELWPPGEEGGGGSA